MNLVMWDVYGDDPDVEDLQSWSLEFGLEYPVLADPQGATGQWYGTKFRSWSTGILIDRGMVLEIVGDATLDDAAALLE